MSSGEEKSNVININKALRDRLDEEIDSLMDVDGDVMSDAILNDKKLQEMNAKHCIINNYGGSTRIITHNYDSVHERRVAVPLSKESFILKYCNQQAKYGKAVSDLGTWWLRHPGRKEYETIIFDPELPPEHEKALNTWKGLNIEPEKGSWRKTRRHIFYIVCNGDKKKFKYFIKWLAYAVQNPGKRAEVAVILKGKKGAGKGFIFTLMVDIFGEHGVTIADRERFTGKFNDVFDRLCFLFADEAYYPGDKEVEGKLKSYITEPRISIEAKFMAPRTIKNCLHIAMATNNDWVIPASQDERRFFINEVDNRYAKGQCSDKTRNLYFSGLHKEMDEAGKKAMLYSLLHVNLAGFHPREDIPDTEELKLQIAHSQPLWVKTVQEFLSEGLCPGQKISGKIGHVQSTGTELFKYLETLNQGTKKVSMVRISEVLKQIGCEKIRTPTGSAWMVPRLSDMKEKYFTHYGQVEWETSYSDWQIIQTGAGSEY